jgi:tRNA-specific 2-thiouridylase
MRRERIVVAMSGGVDSSVAAALLIEQGYEVIGVAMRLWETAGPSGESGCCSLDDFLDARRVAEQLGFPFYVMDFRDELRRSVVADFVAEYRRGRTPNPCARCNQFVKFAPFWHRARELGATLMATGHYARRRVSEHGVELLRGVDEEKDQSYFLFSIDPAVLRRTLFPVGELTKRQVRREAERLGLAIADKPDSQEVCFAPRHGYVDFVESQASPIALRSGDVVDEDGNVLGRHGGVHRFTIGQRRGLGLRTGGPARYVTEIDPETAEVRVAREDQVFSDVVEAAETSWLGPVPRPGTAVRVKIRSRFAPQPAWVLQADGDSFRVAGNARLRAVTPGQAAVLYDGDRVIGGGWIRRGLRRQPTAAETSDHAGG